MIDYREQPESNIVEITIDGKITREEYDKLASQLEAKIKAHGSVRVLEEVRSIGGIEPSVFWKDAKFGFRHLNDFSSIAVVADQKWIEWVTKIFKPIMRCPVAVFHLDQIEQAREWIQQQAPRAAG